MRRGVVAGGLLLIIATSIAGWLVLSHAAPGRLTLSATRPSPPGAATPAPAGDPYLAACPKIPKSSATEPAGRWLIGGGSLAGFRVHELFLEQQAPNEAVARTSDVAGGILLSGSTSALRLSDACVSVSTLTLHSVDVVPGLRTTDRDHIFLNILEANKYPQAVFHASDVTLPAQSAAGQKVKVPLDGELTMHGVTRPVSLTLDGILQGSQIQLAGGFPIELGEFGMSPPENPMAAVDSKVTIEFQLFLDRA